MGGVVSVYGMIDGIMRDVKTVRDVKCVSDIRAISIVCMSKKSLKFQLVIEKPICVPDNYTQGGWH
jgi:hypothetical protein